MIDWFKNNQLVPSDSLFERFAAEHVIPHESSLSSKNFYIKLHRILKREKALRGDRKKILYAEEFKFSDHDTQPVTGIRALKLENMNLKRTKMKLEEKVNARKSAEKNYDDLVRENQVFHSENEKLRQLNSNLEEKLFLREQENICLKRNLDCAKKAKKKLLKKLGKKKIGTSNTALSKKLASDHLKYKEIIHDWQRKLNELEISFSNLKTMNKVLRLEKRKLGKKISLLKARFLKVKVKDVDDYENKIKSLSDKIEKLYDENRELQQQTLLLDYNNLITFENGRFNNHVRKAVMELVGNGVSINKIDDVIKAVLGSFTPYNVENLKLPSKTTKATIAKEALCVAQLHVVEEMTSNENFQIGNCLHGDGTTKYSKHYQNFQISTQSGKTLSLGLHEVADADAASVLNSFQNSISDLVDVLNGDKEKDFNRLVASITNTMSDMDPVNPLFNKKLKAFRENLLPSVIDKWQNLTQEEKNSFIEMGNFFCRLHLLTNFATETDKILKDFENAMVLSEHENKFAFNTKEAGPVQTVRIAAKALHDRGSDECGVASDFNSFLGKKGKSKKIESFVGNRFNILYYNAAAVYYHHDDIINFINTSFSSPNKLILSLDELMKNKFNVACMRALGIAGKIVCCSQTDGYRKI